MTRWRRLAVALLVVVVVVTTAFIVVGQRQQRARDDRQDRQTAYSLCVSSQQNYDAVTRILSTGPTQPLVLPSDPPFSPAQLAYIGAILTQANTRGDDQKAAIDKVRGPRPVCVKP